MSNQNIPIEASGMIAQITGFYTLTFLEALASVPLVITNSGTVITTKYGEENDVAPIATLSLVSHSPRIDSIALHPTRHTSRNLKANQNAVANFFFHDDNIANRLYTLADSKYEKGDQKIADAGFTLVDTYTSGVKRIKEADAWIEYQVIGECSPTGADRSVTFLSVALAYAKKGILNPETGLVLSGLPIVKYLGCNAFRIDKSDNQYAGGTAAYSMKQHREHTFRK